MVSKPLVTKLLLRITEGIDYPTVSVRDLANAMRLVEDQVKLDTPVYLVVNGGFSPINMIVITEGARVTLHDMTG